MLALSKRDPLFYTIQGEGKYIGYPTVFVRLSRCNLRCAWKNPDGSITKCDTPYTSFEPEVNEVSIKNIVEEVCAYHCKHVVISGGEPFFQKDKFVELTNELVNEGKYVTIETNGTLYHKSDAQFLSISPKLKSSCADELAGERHNKQRLNFDTLAKMVQNHDYQFKFVVNTGHDVTEILEIRDTLMKMVGIDITDHIWLMPQGTTVEQLDRNLVNIAEMCKMYKWKMTDRIHIRVWGSVPGV